jgi:hypothetical protein
MKLPFLTKKQNKSALYNPTKPVQSGFQEVDVNNVADFEQHEFPIELSDTVSESQIKLNIRESSMEPMYKVKRSISKIEIAAEAIPFWKSTVSVITLTFSILTLVVFGFLIYFYYPRFPAEMPIFYDHSNGRWQLFPKSIFLFLPPIFAAIATILWKVNYSVFFFDKRLALVVTWIILLLALLNLIAIAQILSLVLI